MASDSRQIAAIAQLVASGGFARAVKECEELLSRRGDSPRLLNLYGASLAGIGRFAESVQVFERVVQLRPAASAHFNLGMAHEHAGRLRVAVCCYRLAVQMDSAYTPAHAALKRLGADAQSEHVTQQPVPGLPGERRQRGMRLTAWVGVCVACLLTVTLLVRAPHSGARQGTAQAVPSRTSTPAATGAYRFGRVEIGAFSPEAMDLCGLQGHSIAALDSDDTYQRYRLSVRYLYGADLPDMNYLGVGMPGWAERYAGFERWLLRAGHYGSPTVAIEPAGPRGFAAFSDSPEMQRLRAAFAAAGRCGIVVWVRFASECNLRLSDYSVYNSPAEVAAYRRSARWFKSYMPSNVRLVFSPLINTVYLRDHRQMRTVRAMYEPGVYDRIGGTLYATYLHPAKAFDWYYRLMKKLDPSTPFQICELGGPVAKRREMVSFISDVSTGRWPSVERINLFAGELNPRATRDYGPFGFVASAGEVSYLQPMFRGAVTGAGQERRR